MAGYPRPGQYGIDPANLPKDLRKEMTRREFDAGAAFDADATREQLDAAYRDIAGKLAIENTLEQ